MSNVGSAIFEFGGGFDWIFYKGLGVGFEISALGNSTGGVGTAGLNLSYHFLPDGPGPEPFVVGGMSFGSPPESGLDGCTWAAAGGGINYWFGNGMAFRAEVRGRYDLEYDDHMIGIRVCVATPRALYDLKKGTVRPLDHQDAEALRQQFDLEEE